MKLTGRVGVKVAFYAVVILSMVASAVPPTRAQSTPLLEIDSSLLPPEMGQTELTVFVEETGHTVSGMMLDYWRANGSASIYGNPISEPFAGTNGLFSQAFERGIFQYSPDWVWTDDPTVRLQPVGRELASGRHDIDRADGRRQGGDRRLDAWTPVAASESRAADVLNTGGRISEETGFSIEGAFADWFDAHEGQFYLGAPLSEPHRAHGRTVQVFEGGTLARVSEDTVVLLPLPESRLKRLGVDTTPIEQNDLPIYDEDLFIERFSPLGIGVGDLQGRRWIVVDVDRQTLTAYQGETVVVESLISTGLSPNDTEIGNFHVRMKREKQDMSGFTNATGEVVTTGSQVAEGQRPPPGEQYEVKDVPDVMYINYDAEALHGAYWHDNFGNRMSHGCINLPLDVSSFLFDWAPLGTAVTVTGPEPVDRD